MTFSRSSIQQAVLVFGLALMVIGLSVSLFLISLGGMIIALNWIVEARFKEKLVLLQKNKPALAVLGLFLLHIIWLWNTGNFDYAAKDLRIKLPLLFLPVVLGSTKALSEKTWYRLFYLLVASVAVGTLMGWWYYFFSFDPDTENIRKIVFFNSPIRFALLIVLCLAFLLHKLVHKRLHWGWAAFALVWSGLFLLVLQSLTGMLITLLLLLGFWIYRTSDRTKGAKRQIIKSIPIWVSLLAAGSFYFGFHSFTNVKNTPYNDSAVEMFSAGGEEYVHHLDNTEVQDNNYIYRYIAPDELERAWNRNSNYDYWGFDDRGQSMRHTIFRYMTSMGLRKDSLGFSQLTAHDVRRIENGYTSSQQEPNPLERRINSAFYEYNAFLNGASPQGSSIIQRITYFNTGWEVVKENWLFGVGTGDVNDAMLRQYEVQNAMLSDEHRRRPHNQYLTFMISFGILGALYFLWMNIFLITAAVKKQHFLAVAFTAMMALSFLAEDTLETQVGVSMFALFTCLFFMPERDNSASQ